MWLQPGVVLLMAILSRGASNSGQKNVFKLLSYIYYQNSTTFIFEFSYPIFLDFVELLFLLH